MSSETDRRARAEARRSSAVIQRSTLHEGERDLSPISGVEALSLATRLTRESWSLSGRPLPSYSRKTIPVRFVPGRLT